MAVTQHAEKEWFVYLLECLNGRLYTGITTNLENRFRRHKLGKGGMFTKRNPPSHMIAATACKDRSDASKLEYAIKNLTPQQKRLVASQWACQLSLSKKLPSTLLPREKG